MIGKKFFLMIVTLLASLILTLPASAVYVETFSTNNASWYYGYGSNFSTVVAATWVSPGGNPGGYISGGAQNLYAVWTYTTAPYGNMNGLTLKVDTMVTGSGTGNAQFYVGRAGTYFIDGAWAIGNDINWTTHSVALNASNFTSWTGNNTNLGDLAWVLQAPDDIGIFFGGNLAGGIGTLKVDNYGTVPIPAAVWLLGSGLIGLVAVRRRMKK